METWNDTWSSAVEAASAKLRARVPEAESFVQESANAQKQSIHALLAAFADGKIDRETLEGELRDQKRVLHAELLALRAITKKAAQDSANVFFEVLEKALVGGIAGITR